MPKRKKLLSHTRPKHATEQETKWSAKKTRSIIRAHHQLQKKITKARAANNQDAVEQLQAKVEELGGISAYQRASIIGQTKERGGDTSEILVQWLKELEENGDNGDDKRKESHPPYRLLEVGCLRIDNACSRSGLFEMRRLDLNSQHSEIEQQDFMQLSAPDKLSLTHEGYDLISLSLVLNYFSDAAERGEMLRKAGSFLRDAAPHSSSRAHGVFPSIFVVLPGPCLTNSRYLDEAKFSGIMAKLGYELARKKYSAKLAYMLWRKVGTAEKGAGVPKQEILRGATRNNFAIVLNPKE